MRRRTGAVLSALLLISMLHGGTAAQPALEPANEQFQRVWERTDRPVEDEVVDRTWMWGPAVSGELVERYDDAETGERVVQYFDKSRMEITHPESGDPGSRWYVTNGLLAVELISGRMQVAAHEYERRFPAEINVAGDQGFPNGPAYATFGKFLDRYVFPDDSFDRGNALIVERIDRAGIETTDESLESQGIRLAHYDEVTKYNIAEPFWSFMTASGTVYEEGSYVDEPLFESPFYATGRPIVEPFWSNVVVAGAERLVLIQCFERRCLTYTPDNPGGWKVEAGNIGQHYFQWRYAEPPKIEGEILFFRTTHYSAQDRYETDMFLAEPDGSNLRNLTSNFTPSVEESAWSPNGDRIAFIAEGDLYIMDADGANLQQITEGEGVDGSPDWSPGGSLIAFHRAETSNVTHIFVVGVDSKIERQVTSISLVDVSRSMYPDWSPDGSRIAFSNRRVSHFPAIHSGGIYTVAPDGTDLVEIVAPERFYVGPLWSPDGKQILFFRPVTASRELWGNGVYSVDVETGSSSVVVVVGEDYSNPSFPTWSPEGSRIAAAITPNMQYGPPLGTRGIHTVDWSSLEKTQITHIGGEPAWAPGGNYLAFSFGMNPGGIAITDLTGLTQWVVTDDGWFPQWRPVAGQ